MNNNYPVLVSVITVVYNGEAFISKTIESVIGQTYNNIEYIIIDGGSTDSTLKIIEKYRKNISIIVSEEDSGIYNAMNKGIELSRGDIIGIINADDYYDNNAIENIVEFFKKNRCDIVFGDKIMLDLNGKYSSLCSVEVPKTLADVNISVVHPTVFVKRTVYKDLLFDESYKICADRDFFYRAYNKGYEFAKVENIIAYMRDGGASTKFVKPIIEGYKVRKKYIGFIKAASVFISMIIGYSKKYFSYWMSKKIVINILKKIR